MVAMRLACLLAAVASVAAFAPAPVSTSLLRSKVNMRQAELRVHSCAMLRAHAFAESAVADS
jgi:hypothetical protein